MEGQEPAAGVPEEVIPQVREVLDQMLSGEFSRFDVFTGPINDNKGEEIIPAGVSLTQSDLEGIDESVGSADRPRTLHHLHELVGGRHRARR